MTDNMIGALVLVAFVYLAVALAHGGFWERKKEDVRGRHFIFVSAFWPVTICVSALVALKEMVAELRGEAQRDDAKKAPSFRPEDVDLRGFTSQDSSDYRNAATKHDVRAILGGASMGATYAAAVLVRQCDAKKSWAPQSLEAIYQSESTFVQTWRKGASFRSLVAEGYASWHPDGAIAFTGKGYRTLAHHLLPGGLERAEAAREGVGPKVRVS